MTTTDEKFGEEFEEGRRHGLRQAVAMVRGYSRIDYPDGVAAKIEAAAAENTIALTSTEDILTAMADAVSPLPQPPQCVSVSVSVLRGSIVPYAAELLADHPDVKMIRCSLNSRAEVLGFSGNSVYLYDQGDPELTEIRIDGLPDNDEWDIEASTSKDELYIALWLEKSGPILAITVTQKGTQ